MLLFSRLLYSVYESILLMILFSMLVIAILNFRIKK
ncbi:putative holin-like toxin [Serpentinicella alkaliphila]